ncbi:hypothetical protein IAT40_007284 [Kwoniella sp. CBS 6097]
MVNYFIAYRVGVSMDGAVMAFMHVYARVLTGLEDIASGHHEINGMDQDFFVFEKRSPWSKGDTNAVEVLLSEFCQSYSHYDQYEADYAKDVL